MPPSASPPPLRVLVADDQELVRAGFRLILEAAGFTVVGEACDGAEALALAASERPDVVLMDITESGSLPSVSQCCCCGVPQAQPRLLIEAA